MSRPMKGKSLELRARGPGADPRTERRTRAPSQGPSKAKLSWERWVCFLPGLALLVVCVCWSSCRGSLGRLGRVRPVSVASVVLSFVGCPTLLSGCVSLCGRRPENRYCFKGIPWLRITAYAVWDRLSGCRGKFWDFGSLFGP